MMIQIVIYHIYMKYREVPLLCLMHPVYGQDTSLVASNARVTRYLIELL